MFKAELFPGSFKKKLPELFCILSTKGVPRIGRKVFKKVFQKVGNFCLLFAIRNISATDLYEI